MCVVSLDLVALPYVAPDILESPRPDDPHTLPDDQPQPDPLDDILETNMPQYDDDGTQSG